MRNTRNALEHVCGIFSVLLQSVGRECSEWEHILWDISPNNSRGKQAFQSTDHFMNMSIDLSDAMYSHSTFDLAERCCLPLLVVMYLVLQSLLLCVLHLPPHLPFMYLGGLALTFHSKMLAFSVLCIHMKLNLVTHSLWHSLCTQFIVFSVLRIHIKLNLVTHSLWHSLCTQFTEIVFLKHNFS